MTFDFSAGLSCFFLYMCVFVPSIIWKVCFSIFLCEKGVKFVLLKPKTSVYKGNMIFEYWSLIKIELIWSKTEELKLKW